MIVSLGEALIDLISSKTDSMTFKACPGGSPMNTAVAMARLGVPVSFLSQISRDFFGNELVSFLKENGIATDLLLRSDHPTTLGFAKKDETGSVNYAFYSREAADRSIAAGSLSEDLPPGIQALQIGSISLMQEPGASTITDFILRQARKNPDLVISFDPNLRPSMVENPGLYKTRFISLCGVCSIVKLSDEDLEWLFPGMSLKDAGSMLLDMGPSLIALTSGAKGSLLINRGGIGRSGVGDVTVVDTVGAGDTFHGGLLAWLYRNNRLTRSALGTMDEETLNKAAAFASRAADITCSREGADPPRMDEM